MRKSLMSCALIALLCSCGQLASNPEFVAPANPEVKAAAVTPNFDWLVGKWNRANEESGQLTHEIWTKENAQLFTGISYTLKEKDTVWQERLTLSPLNEHWTLQIFLPEMNQEVHFRLTDIQATAFVSENPENDFPQKIAYQKSGDKIHAQIATGSKKIDYFFEPIN